MTIPNFDWIEKCPFCEEQFFGYTGYTNAEVPIPYDKYHAGLNPYLKLINHVPEKHQDKMITCGSDTKIAFWRTDNTCSYCGGLNPDIVLERIEKGCSVDPTDKNYKIYVSKTPNSYSNDKTYFYHFSDEQKYRFIELYNKTKIAIGYPGYFYTTPYFINWKKK